MTSKNLYFGYSDDGLAATEWYPEAIEAPPPKSLARLVFLSLIHRIAAKKRSRKPVSRIVSRTGSKAH
jgi:hypothetical protein